MTNPSFSIKLDALPGTLDLFSNYDAMPLAAALAGGTGHHALSIGSGGSAIAAEYLSRCRDSLGLGPTTVQTPMQVVLEQHPLCDSEVWIFSAGGNNPDVAAAVRAAFDRRCAKLHFVTRNPNGDACGIAMRGGGSVHVVPVFDPKDGFLATHSLVSSVVAMLLACDAASQDPSGAEGIRKVLTARVAMMRDTPTRLATINRFKDLRRCDTIIIVADPLLRPLAVLLDTSIWEAALCSVQTTDFRNFAHGRHTWLHHRSKNTVVLALAGTASRAAWSIIDKLIPPSLRRRALDYDGCGRLENALAVIDGLGIIEAMGAVVSIDPGRPGVGEFGPPIYEDRSLDDLARELPPSVRHKRAAIARSDSSNLSDVPLLDIKLEWLTAMANAEIGGLVLDWDGTLVTTDGRCDPPHSAIIEEIVRLHSAGLAIGIATGRGGSAGEGLRKVCSMAMLSTILVGYYNGGHLRTADVDIREDPAPESSVIAETAAWLRLHSHLFVEQRFKKSGVQIAVDFSVLRHPYRFILDLADCPSISEGKVRVLASGHSYDIVPVTSSKLVVLNALRKMARQGTEILCFGDSGSRQGNDHALLSQRFGISVGDVCGSADGCWSLFGASPIGPDALLRALQALKKNEAGAIRLDIPSLRLDSR